MDKEKSKFNKYLIYGRNFLLLFLIVINVFPEYTTEPAYNYYKNKKFSTFLENLEPYKGHNFDLTINRVIEKVENSRQIVNKDSVIDRLRGVRFMLNPNDSDNSKMYYYYDRFTMTDYIVVRTNSFINSDYITLIHELNHLVDKHRVNEIDIPPSSVMIDFKFLTKEEYLSYYMGINPITILDNDNNDSIIEQYNLLSLFYDGMENNLDYYFSDSEIYARLSSMKNFLLESGYIDNITDEVQECHIFELLSDVRELNYEYVYVTDKDKSGNESSGLKDGNVTKGGISEYKNLFEFLDDSDFIYLLPFINWNKLEEINYFI